MTRHVTVALLVLLAAMGCTTHTFEPFGVDRARLLSDAQLYSSAYGVAVDRLEQSPALGFEAHLELALADIGLTPRGFRYYVDHHPELALDLEVRYADRIAAVEQIGPAFLTSRAPVVTAPEGRLALALTRP